MAFNIQKSRTKLRKDMAKAGFDLQKKVYFWGKNIELGNAISIMDKDDIKDAKKMIDWKKQGRMVI